MLKVRLYFFCLGGGGQSVCCFVSTLQIMLFCCWKYNVCWTEKGVYLSCHHLAVPLSTNASPRKTSHRHCSSARLNGNVPIVVRLIFSKKLMSVSETDDDKITFTVVLIFMILVTFHRHFRIKIHSYMYRQMKYVTRQCQEYPIIKNYKLWLSL